MLEINTSHRMLTDHKIDGIDNILDIAVLDQPGSGNACHQYGIGHCSAPDEHGNVLGSQLCQINFQEGPVKEAGVNGITIECLLTICLDRLRGFQSGDFACEANRIALEYVDLALHTLKARTQARLRRGVEGTNVK